MIVSGYRDLVPPDVVARYRAEGWWGDEPLSAHIDRHAHERPDGIAFVADGDRCTWAQYRDASDRLAGVLMAAGLEPGERVAVWLPDGATVHIAYVANEKAGLTTVGIGARAGRREVEHLLNRTQAAALVSFAEHGDGEVAELVADLRSEGLLLRHHIVVPRFEAEPDGSVVVDGMPCMADAGGLDAAIAARRLGPNDLFMINSTSGTTGLPKCVMHTQNRWVYFTRAAVRAGALTGDDVFLGAVPAPFGFGLWTAHFTPTLLGAPVVIGRRFDTTTAMHAIEQERVTVLCGVSTQFLMLLNAPDLGDHDLSSLRVMFTGGEAVPYERARDFERTTGCTVLQFYGSNESGLATGTTLADPEKKRLQTAGRGVDGTELRLYDDGVDVTASGRGQPATRGPATCLGYLDDPEANAQLFVDDGFVLHADLCEIDADGYLSVVGRTSDLVIRGGKNISAPQVEAEVSTHPAVALAAVVPMPDPVFGERVCLYAELVDGATLTLDELTAHLAERGVSRELFPERLIVLDELPRSSGAKIAKGELRHRAGT